MASRAAAKAATIPRNLSAVARAKARKEAAAARAAAELSSAELLRDVIAQVQAREDSAAAWPDPEGAAADRAENPEMAALEAEPEVWVFAGLPDPDKPGEMKRPAAKVHGGILRRVGVSAKRAATSRNAATTRIRKSDLLTTVRQS